MPFFAVAKRPIHNAPREPSLSPQRAKEIFQAMKAKAEQILADRPIQEAPFGTWSHMALEYIEQAFGSDTGHVAGFVGQARLLVVGPYGGPSEEQLERERFKLLMNRVAFLGALIEQLDFQIQFIEPAPILPASAVAQKNSHTVFVVHGRNHGVRDSVARFISTLGLEPVILDELPNEGQTVIEKFLRHAEVGFAVVLLTGDDSGGLIGTSPEQFKPRARQNVIFELGYFVGKLGRQRVCAVLESGVEKPTDYDGVLFVTLDNSGGWKVLLAREMKAAGLAVDMNRAL